MRRKENNSEHKKDKKRRKTSKNKTPQDARQMGTNVHLSEKNQPNKTHDGCTSKRRKQVIVMSKYCETLRTLPFDTRT